VAFGRADWMVNACCSVSTTCTSHGSSPTRSSPVPVRVPHPQIP